MIDKRFIRNIGVISEEEQEILANTSIAIFGAGGLGGVVAEILTRTGLSSNKVMFIVDFDKVDYSNINRQIIANTSTIGQYKAELLSKRISNIGTIAKPIISYSKDFFKEDYKVDLIIDCTDNYSSKYYNWEQSMKKGLPYIFGGVAKNLGVVSIFENSNSFFPKNNNEIKPIIASTVFLTGSIITQQTINFLLNKNYISYPNVISINASIPSINII